MRRVAWTFVSVIAIGLLLVGCGKSGPPGNSGGKNGARAAASGGNAAGGKIKIGFLVKQPDEPWFQNEWKFADEAAAQYGFQVIKIGARDGDHVLTALDNLAAMGAQGVIICTPDVKLGPAIVAKCKVNHLKLFSVDDRFVGSDGKFMDVPYMGISARKIGKMVGEALVDERKQRGWEIADTAAMGIGQMELDTARERLEGATEALVAGGFPKDRIFSGALLDKADVSTAIDAANILLTKHGDVKNWLVFGMNDESVLGGIRALEGRGIGADRSIGVGIGGTTGMVDWEKEKPTGFFEAVLISPYRHGYETAQYMYKWIKDGVEPPMTTFTDGILIGRDNYKKIMKEQGLLN